MRRPRNPDLVTQLGSGSSRGRDFSALEPRRAPERAGVVSGAVFAHPALVGLSEREFQAIVRSALEQGGFVVWVVPNMKLTTAGLPDILAWHPRWPGRLLAWELKTETGKPTPKQRAALAHLETVPGIDARIVRPSDWPALRDALLGCALEIEIEARSE